MNRPIHVVHHQVGEFMRSFSRISLFVAVAAFIAAFASPSVAFADEPNDGVIDSSALSITATVASDQEPSSESVHETVSEKASDADTRNAQETDVDSGLADGADSGAASG